MGGLSKKERADKDLLAYKLRMKKRAEDGKPPLEVDEKGRYLSLLYDINNGRKFLPQTQKIFDELHKKYGKTN